MSRDKLKSEAGGGCKSLAESILDHRIQSFKVSEYSKETVFFFTKAVSFLPGGVHRSRRSQIDFLLTHKPRK